MATIIERRRALHNNLKAQKEKNETLEMQMGQLQALANIGTNTCMIAHEINNLLTPLSNYAQMALANPDDKAFVAKALTKTDNNIQKLSKIVNSMLAVANGEDKEKTDINLAGIIDEVFDCLCRDFSKDNIVVKLDIPADLTVNGISVQIQQVFMNLILNSKDAMIKGGGTLTITAQRQSNSIVIAVSDTGCGINKDNIDSIFSPFFSTKKDCQESAGGNGLGLAFCKKIIDEHNGQISVSSITGEGTTFTITIPEP